MTLKKTIIISLFLILIVSLNCNISLTDEEKLFLSEKQEIVFVGQTNYPPFEFINENNMYDGMIIEQIRWISTELGFKAVFTHKSFSEAQADVLSGKADVISSFFYSEKRDEDFDFTETIYDVPAIIFVKKERTDIKDIADLNNKIIAIQKGDYAEEYLNSMNVQHRVLWTDDFEEALFSVIDGTADAIIGDEQIVLYEIYKQRLTDKIKTVGSPLYIGQDCMAVKEGNTILVDILKKGIKHSKDSGVYARIYQKWLGTSLNQQSDLWGKYANTIIYISLFIICVFIIAFIWIKKLKIEVHKRTVQLSTVNEELKREIEENSKVTEKLFENEMKFRNLSEQMMNGVAVVRNNRYIWVNSTFETVTGLSRDQLIDNEHRIFRFPKNRIDSDLVKWNDIVKHHEGKTFEAEVMTRDEKIYVDISMKTITFGKESAIQIIISDITARKNAELKLIDISDKNKALLDSIPDLMFVHDIDGKIIDFNSKGNTVLLLPERDVINTDLSDLPLSNETIELVIENIREALRTGETQTVRYSFSLNSNEMYYEAKISRLNDTQALSLVRDVTQTMELLEAVEKDREFLSVTLDSIGDAVIICDTNGNILLLNKVAEDLTGFYRSECEGSNLEEVFKVVNNKTGNTIISPVRKVLDTGKIQGVQDSSILISRTGRKYSISTNAAPIVTKDGNILGVVLVFRDETQKRRIEEEASKAQKLESIGILAGGIAHDFNNILTAINGNISLARLIEDEEKKGKYLSHAEKAVEQAKKLSMQLLTFSKGGDPIRETVSIKEIIEDSAGFVLRGSKVKCNLTFQEDLKPASLDKGQFSQVIQNIVLNANQAMPDGGSIDIKASNAILSDSNDYALAGGDYVKIEIRDSGGGISQENLEKIFDPYFTTKTDGHGLGLAIVYSIIKKHHGLITFESIVGHGTIVTILLPSADKKFERIDEEPDTTPDGKGHILIMDDNDDVRAIIGSSLNYLGYTYSEADDGLAAIEIYKKTLNSSKRFDAVLMDLTVPGGMSGKEAVQEILKIDPNAQVIVISGYSRDPILANYSDYGFVGKLVKPFQMQEMKEVLNKVIKKDEMHQNPQL